MKQIPEEIKEILNQAELKESVEQIPGSQRFKAMVLGLSAFRYLRPNTEINIQNEKKPKN